MNIGNITTNRYTYGNYELANKKICLFQNKILTLKTIF